MSPGLSRPSDAPARDTSALPSAWPEFIPVRTLPAALAATPGYPLGTVRFARAAEPLPHPGPAPVVELPQLGATELAEVWFSRSPVRQAVEGAVRLAWSDDLLFAAVQLRDHADAVIEAATCDGYRRLLGLAARHGFPHILRMWNHFPGINRDTAGLERYRQFCVGRHQAFAEQGCALTEGLPAASAVGTPGGETLTVYLLAARTPGTPIENPRQVSAFRYPPQYGPRSPSFSRGMLAQMGRERQLFLSGTASILGHATLHAGDAEAQLQETLRNMEAVLRAADRRRTLAGLAGTDLVKVYLRDPAHLAAVTHGLAGRIGAAGLLCVQGDICRADLLLEIEAVVRWRER